MKIFNITFCILFVLFALLQYNDPDPWLWMPIYLYGALLCWLTVKGRYYPWLLRSGILAYTVYAGYLFLRKDGVWEWLTQHNAGDIAATMQANKPWIEASREFLGLMMLNLVLVADMVWLEKIQRAAALENNA